MGRLMTEPKTKTAKELGELSETAKSYIAELFIESTTGFRDEVVTLEMTKGIVCEQDSMELVQKVLGGTFRRKNKERLSVEVGNNSLLKGTPDIILTDVIEDIKTSFTAKTFFFAGLEPTYYWQGQAYMYLAGIKNYRLIYCLVDTPSDIIVELQKQMYYKFNCQEDHPDYIRISEQIKRNHTVSHIDPNERVKVYEFTYDHDAMTHAIDKVFKAEKYYETLKLNQLF